MKKLETWGIVILIIIGTLWGGFEVWIRRYADGTQLIDIAIDYARKKQFFKAKFTARLALKAGKKEAKILTKGAKKISQIFSQIFNCCYEKNPHNLST